MNTSEFKKVYWKYYLILERDVLDVEPYVAFHSENYKCFSNEFIKLYQVICSEIDVICKKYCEYIKDTTSSTGGYKNINEYAKFILKQHPDIVKQNVELLDQSDCELIPWKGWNYDYINGTNHGTPEWWKAYNHIKHRRSDKDDNEKYYYQSANLYNVLNALAALYVLEKYFYTDLAKSEAAPGKHGDSVITPYSELFRLFESDETLLAIYGFLPV